MRERIILIRLSYLPTRDFYVYPWNRSPHNTMSSSLLQPKVHSLDTRTFGGLLHVMILHKSRNTHLRTRPHRPHRATSTTHPPPQLRSA